MRKYILSLVAFAAFVISPAYAYDAHTLIVPADFLQEKPVMTSAIDPSRRVLESLARGDARTGVFALKCGLTKEQRDELANLIEDPTYISGVRSRVRASIAEYKRLDMLTQQLRGCNSPVRRPSIAEIVIYQGMMELRLGDRTLDC